MKQGRLLLPEGARKAVRERSALMGLLRSYFRRTQTWLQAGKYVSVLVSELPSAERVVARRARRGPDAW